MRHLDAREVQYAPKAADIVYQVPMLLRTNFTGTTPDEAFEIIQSRADTLGIRAWVDNCEDNARDRRTHYRDSEQWEGCVSMDSTALTRDVLFYLLFLDKIFLDIRGFDIHEVQDVPKIAYIVHNVPTLLLPYPNGLTPDKADEALDVIRSRADALGVRAWVDACERDAREKLAYYHNPG